MMSFEGSRDPTPEPTDRADGASTPWDEDMLDPDDVAFPNEEVDDVVVDQFDGEKIVGLCEAMCPSDPSELSRNRSILFESTNRDKTDYDDNKIVKAYARADAGKETRACLIRTPRCLYDTMRYLLTHVLQLHGTWREWADGSTREIRLIDIYSYMRDRFRSVRNDFSIQSHKSLWSIRSLEYTVRFHIMAGHLLCNRHPGSGFDAKGNRDMLDDALIDRLWGYYDVFREKYRDPKTGLPTPGVPALRNIGEFAAYRLLYKELAQHDDHKKWRESTECEKPWLARSNTKRSSGAELKALSSMPEVLSHPLVKNAMKIIGLYTSDSWPQFFESVKTAPYLQACLMVNVFSFARVTWLSKIWLNEKFSSGKKTIRLPLELVKNRLLFDNDQDTKKFVETIGYEVDPNLEFITGAETAPDCEYCEPQNLRFPSLVVEARRHHQSHLAVCIGDVQWSPNALPESEELLTASNDYALSEDSEYQEDEPSVTAVGVEPPVIPASNADDIQEDSGGDQPPIPDAVPNEEGKLRDELMDLILDGNIPPPPGPVPELPVETESDSPPTADPLACSTTKKNIPLEATGERSALELTLDQEDAISATKSDTGNELRPVPPPELESPPRLTAASAKKLVECENVTRIEISNFEKKGRQAILTEHTAVLERTEKLRSFYRKDSNLSSAIRPSRKKLLARLRQCVDEYKMNQGNVVKYIPGCFQRSVSNINGLSGRICSKLATIASKSKSNVRLSIPFVELSPCKSSLQFVAQLTLWELFSDRSMTDHISVSYRSSSGTKLLYQSWCELQAGFSIVRASDVIIIPVVSDISSATESVLGAVNKSIIASTRLGTDPPSGVLVFFFQDDASSQSLTAHLREAFRSENLEYLSIHAINARSASEGEILQAWSAAVSHQPTCSYLPTRSLFCEAASVVSSITRSRRAVISQQYQSLEGISGVWSVLLHIKALFDTVVEAVLKSVEELQLCEFPDDTSNDLSKTWSTGVLESDYLNDLLCFGGRSGADCILEEVHVRDENNDTTNTKIVYSDEGLRVAAGSLFGASVAESLLSSIKNAVCGITENRLNVTEVALGGLLSILCTQPATSRIGVPQSHVSFLRASIRENVLLALSPPLAAPCGSEAFEKDFSELVLILNPDLMDEDVIDCEPENKIVEVQQPEQEMDSRTMPATAIEANEPRSTSVSFSPSFLSDMQSLRDQIAKRQQALCSSTSSDVTIPDICSETVSGYIVSLKRRDLINNITKNFSLENLSNDVLDTMKRRKIELENGQLV